MNDCQCSKLVSVIMPMHNSESYVRIAIDSVLAQTYEKWELIVVDDASTDHSRSIVEEYACRDNRVRLLINDTPVGMPYSPRNYGIKHANGDYIAFLDSDDVWLPNKLEEQLPLFSNSRVAVVFSDYEKINERGYREGRCVNTPRSVNYSKLLYSNVIGNLTGIFDVKKVGKVYFQPIHHEDYAFWLSILKKGFIASSTQHTHALYRVRENSVSSRKILVASWQWGIYRDIENISFWKSCCYFVVYAFKAFKKGMI